jgi:hypothetical protein
MGAGVSRAVDAAVVARAGAPSPFAPGRAVKYEPDELFA